MYFLLQMSHMQYINRDKVGSPVLFVLETASHRELKDLFRLSTHYCKYADCKFIMCYESI